LGLTEIKHCENHQKDISANMIFIPRRVHSMQSKLFFSLYLFLHTCESSDLKGKLTIADYLNLF